MQTLETNKTKVQEERVQFMINEFSGICDKLTSQLLDIYQMADWGMDWKTFVETALKEIEETLYDLKNETMNE